MNRLESRTQDAIKKVVINLKIKAAVTEGQGQEFEIKEVTLDEPKAGEVLIKILAFHN